MLVITRLGPAAGQAVARAPIAAVAKARRGDVLNLVDEAAPFVIHDDDAALSHRRDVGSAAAARQTNALAVLFDPVSIQIAKAVDLRAADEAEIDSPALQ